MCVLKSNKLHFIINFIFNWLLGKLLCNKCKILTDLLFSIKKQFFGRTLNIKFLQLRSNYSVVF